MSAVALLQDYADKKPVFKVCIEFPSYLITQQCKWMPVI